MPKLIWGYFDVLWSSPIAPYYYQTAANIKKLFEEATNDLYNKLNVILLINNR
jgi:hypothetical protein